MVAAPDPPRWPTGTFNSQFFAVARSRLGMDILDTWWRHIEAETLPYWDGFGDPSQKKCPGDWRLCNFGWNLTEQWAFQQVLKRNSTARSIVHMLPENTTTTRSDSCDAQIWHGAAGLWRVCCGCLVNCTAGYMTGNEIAQLVAEQPLTKNGQPQHCCGGAGNPKC